ncbi:MAG: carboxymuconolactone decarboxylase family protein [Actinomycetota bacterium]
MPRITPIEAPFAPEDEELLAAMMPPGVPPIALFRTFVRNRSMTRAMRGWGGYELGRELSLDLRTRELVIDRTCARCGAEYEWGVHVAFFAERAELTADQITSLTHGGPADHCWTDPLDRAVIEAVDQLHDTSTLDDRLWDELSSHLDDAQVLDLLLLCGWYHAISYVARAAHVPHEDGAPRFDDVRPAG